MRDHAQFAEDLALYAMGALDVAACPELEAHLGTCGECRRELDALRADLALVAMSATGPQPPQRSRQRLMNALAAVQPEEQTGKNMPAPKQAWPRWSTLTPMAAALVLAILCGALVVQNQRLKQDLAISQDEGRYAKEFWDILHDPTAQHMTLVSAQAHRQPQIKAIYQKKKGQVVLIANNLDPIPQKKVYELWLLPANGGAPMPCGTFPIDGKGNGMMIHTTNYGDVDAKAFAVTVEPEGGSDTPTMPIMYAPAG
jgi:anti-sigma-K factor RskA